MSDPIKDLENFDPQGPPMNPLTPSEVRRRGDRMRRRNNGVMALGAAAAVAVVATSGVFIGGALDNDDAGPAPAVSPSQTGSEQTESEQAGEIPADFPLTEGLGDATTTDTAEMSTLDYCGTTPLAGLEPVDVRSTSMSGGEAAITRTVYLLESQEAAVAAHQELLQAAEDCRLAEDSDRGDITIHRDGEGWSGSTVAEDYARGEDVNEPAVTMVNVVSAGQALLVTSTAGYWSADVDAGVGTVRSDDQPLMLAMADFGEYDGPATPEATADGPGSATGSSGPEEIADDYPLLDGWPDDSQAEPGAGNDRKGPNRTLESVEFQACGETWSEPAYVDRLRANWINVEDYRARQLTTYEDADAAVAAVESLIAQQEACPADPERADGYVNNREVRSVPLGGQAWAILERDTMEGNPSPFGASTLVVRVGRAVLVVTHQGHGGYPGGNGQAQIDAMGSQAEAAISAMCAFTEAGC